MQFYVYFAFALQVAVNVEAGSLVLMGGGMLDDNPAYDKVIELSNGWGRSVIGVISAASANPISSAVFYVDLFQSKGAVRATWIPIHEANMTANEDPEVVADILTMSGIFFSGGDQARIINSFYHENRVESSALAAIRQVFNNGGVVSGSSAGAACMGTPPMFMDGWSWEALLYGTFTPDQVAPEYAVIYDPNGGIGMLDHYIVDSHSSERGREGRLIRLLADTKDSSIGALYGLGVDEDTSISIVNVGTANATGEIIGFGGVFIPDISRAVINESGPYYHISEVFASYLTEGDTIDMNTRVVNYSPWKTDISGQESLDGAPISSRIFDGVVIPNQPPEFVRVAVGLFDNVNDLTTFGTTFERNPEFQLDFSKQFAAAEAFAGVSPLYGHRVISYRNIRIEIYANA